MCSTDIFLGVLALIFPPFPVWVKCGICSVDSLINILLCMLGFLPGLLHSWYIIAKYPEPAWEYETVPDSERAERVAYVLVRDDDNNGHLSHHRVVSQPHAGGHQQQQPKPQPQPQHQPNYGSTQQGQESGIMSSAAAPAVAAGPSSGGGGAAVLDHADDDGTVPPSYAEAVGDHKIQNRD